MDTAAPASEAAPKGRAGLFVRAALLLLLAAAGILVTTRYGVDPSVWFARAGRCPGWLFVLMTAFLPLFGFPLAPLYVFAGAVYGVAEGLPLTLLGIALNLTMAYPVYGMLLREPVTRLMAKRGYRPPEIPSAHRFKATVLVTSIPALPFWAQSAVLAIARVPFAMYFGVSFGVHVIIASLMITLGSRAKHVVASPWFFAALGVLGFVIALLAMRRARKKRLTSAVV